MDTRRREDRVAISLPVRVWGMDANHRPFTQTATTLDLTRTGVRLGGLAALLASGEVVGVQHGGEKARFRVVWVGRKGSSQHGQAGLTCVEPGKYIWGAPLQRLAASSPPPLAHTPPKPVPPVQPPVAEKPLNAVGDTNAERRIQTRFNCTGSAQLDNVDGHKAWGTVSDIGPGGCYIEMPVVPPAGMRIQLKVALYGTEFHCGAEILSSYPNVGMRVSFVQMSEEDTDRLNAVLARLAGGCTVPVAPEPAFKAEENPASAPDPRASALSGSIHKIANELGAMDKIIETGFALEPRVLGQLRFSLQQARNNVWSLQQWLQAGAQERDAYKVLTEMETERLRSAANMVRELAIDIDANNIQVGTEGVAELIAAVASLQKRLVSLTQGTRALSDVETSPY
jgi:hypothetical protein